MLCLSLVTTCGSSVVSLVTHVRPPSLHSTARSWLLSLCSAVLLILAYPSPDWGWLAWGALVPLLLAIEDQSPRCAFLLGYGCGFLSFLGILYWLIYVSPVGWILLAAYLALFVGLFGWLVAIFSQRSMRNVECGMRSDAHFALGWLPSAWVTLEWLRSHLLTGFGWGLLGYTQWRWLPMIQAADVVGAYGVSFLVVLVNVALWVGWRARRQDARCSVMPLIVGGVLLLTMGYGWWRLRTPIAGGQVNVAVVQGNIPQSQKWDESRKEDILNTYVRLTRQAARQRPDLIVWPETAVPGFLGADPDVTMALLEVVREIRVPCLVGAPTVWLRSDGVVDYNSAVLVTPEGGLEERYNKLHLVPFGEFLPFERYVPWLRRLLPPMGDFAPGETATVFRLHPSPEGDRLSARSLQSRFSVLICFEDVFPSLARRFVQEGAGWLLVITNDAWFGPTGAAVQHAQASVFRAIENRVSVVRAANTGLSCFIDPWGRLTDSVQDAAGRQLLVEGMSAQPVLVTAGRSIYQRVGDLFAWLCVVWVGWCVIVRRLPLGTKRQGR